MTRPACAGLDASGTRKRHVSAAVVAGNHEGRLGRWCLHRAPVVPRDVRAGISEGVRQHCSRMGITRPSSALLRCRPTTSTLIRLPRTALAVILLPDCLSQGGTYRAVPLMAFISQYVSCQVKQHREIMAHAARQNEQMPDAMKMANLLVENIEDHAKGIKQSARQQPPEACHGQRLQ